MKIRVPNIKKAMLFMLVLALVCCSGVIQFSYIWYQQSLLFVIAYALACFLIMHKKIKKNRIQLFLLLSSIVCLNLLVYHDNPTGHLGLILKILLVMFAGELLTVKEFKSYYLIIIISLAAISLICYFTFMIFPNVIVSHVPLVSYWEHETRYALIYNFPGNGYQYGRLRNYGPFHEGGMFAVFLNIGILFMMDKEQKTNRNKIELLVLIAALLTTFSTSGLLVFFIIIGMKLISAKKYKQILSLVFLLIAGAIAESQLGIIGDKFSETNASFMDRRSEIFLFLNAFINRPILGIGFQNDVVLRGSNLQNGTNGLLTLFVQFGLVGAIPFVMMNINSLRRHQANIFNVIRDILVLMIFWMSEPTIFQPLLLLLLFVSKQSKSGSVRE